MNNVNQEKQKAREDLTTIRIFLDEGHQRVERSGIHFLVWGLFVPLASLGFRTLLLLELAETPERLLRTLYWPIVIGTAMLVMTIFDKRRIRQTLVRGIYSRLILHVWTGFGCSFLAIWIAAMLSNTGMTPVMLGYVAILLGFVYWLHGAMLEMRWFQALSIPWWIAAALMSRMETMAQASLIMSFATMFCGLVPGIILTFGPRSGSKS